MQNKWTNTIYFEHKHYSFFLLNLRFTHTIINYTVSVNDEQSGRPENHRALDTQGALRDIEQAVPQCAEVHRPRRVLAQPGDNHHREAAQAERHRHHQQQQERHHQRHHERRQQAESVQAALARAPHRRERPLRRHQVPHRSSEKVRHEQPDEQQAIQACARRSLLHRPLPALGLLRHRSVARQQRGHTSRR